MSKLTIEWDAARAVEAPLRARLALAVLEIASRLAAWLLYGSTRTQR